MALKNSTTGWGLIARIIHWLMAAMIFAMLIFGTIMSEFTTDLVQKFQMVQQHKSVGFTVFTLAVIRVIWRFMNPTPALPSDMPRWQVQASHISHGLIYALIIAVPLSGWIMSTASPLNDPGAYPVQVRNMVFGLFEMPDLFPTGDKELSEFFHLVHSILTKALAALLLLHIAAALKHHFMDRDTILRRMIRG